MASIPTYTQIRARIARLEGDWERARDAASKAEHRGRYDLWEAGCMQAERAEAAIEALRWVLGEDNPKWRPHVTTGAGAEAAGRAAYESDATGPQAAAQEFFTPDRPFDSSHKPDCICTSCELQVETLKNAKPKAHTVRSSKYGAIHSNYLNQS